jgi:uncharacterized protein (UPF0297 family)
VWIPGALKSSNYCTCECEYNCSAESAILHHESLIKHNIHLVALYKEIYKTLRDKCYPDVVQNVAKLFADDTKLYAAVNNTNDEIKLQGDIDRLMQWSKDWLLTFNKFKKHNIHLVALYKEIYKTLRDK